MQTEIISNGGGRTFPIEGLFERLREHPLDRIWEAYGNFECESDGVTNFFGNFFTYSHVFDIRTDDPELIGRLRQAIAANKCRADYQSQEPGIERKAREEKERWDAILARQEHRERAARGRQDSTGRG